MNRMGLMRRGKTWSLRRAIRSRDVRPLTVESAIRAWCLLLATMAVTACATGPPIPPAYTQEELAARCFRTGGWWHGVPPDSLFSGFCEYAAPRFP
jgi:urea transporter